MKYLFIPIYSEWYAVFVIIVFFIKKIISECTPIRRKNSSCAAVYTVISMDTCIMITVCIVTNSTGSVLPCCMPSTQPSTFQSSQLALKSRSGSSLALKSHSGTSLALEQTS